MFYLICLLFTSLVLFAAEDPWTKVQDLKAGTEIRVYKRGISQPLVGKVDDVKDDVLHVALKSEQVALQRTEIDRIDYRPNSDKSRVTRETKTVVDDPNKKPPVLSPARGAQVPRTSTSNTLTWGSKADFEVLYRRTASTPAK